MSTQCYAHFRPVGSLVTSSGYFRLRSTTPLPSLDSAKRHDRLACPWEIGQPLPWPDAWAYRSSRPTESGESSRLELTFASFGRL